MGAVQFLGYSMGGNGRRGHTVFKQYTASWVFKFSMAPVFNLFDFSTVCTIVTFAAMGYRAAKRCHSFTTDLGLYLPKYVSLGHHIVI